MGQLSISPIAEKGLLTAVPPRTLTGYAPVAGKMLFEHDRLGTGLLESDFVDALRFAHLAVPRFDIGADEVEDPLERRDHHALDVVGGVETEAPGEKKSSSASFRLRRPDKGRLRIGEELFRRDGPVDLRLARLRLEHQVRDSLAVLRLGARVVEHCAGGDRGAGRGEASLTATARRISSMLDVRSRID